MRGAIGPGQGGSSTVSVGVLGGSGVPAEGAPGGVGGILSGSYSFSSSGGVTSSIFNLPGSQLSGLKYGCTPALESHNTVFALGSSVT